MSFYKFILCPLCWTCFFICTSPKQWYRCRDRLLNFIRSWNLFRLGTWKRDHPGWLGSYKAVGNGTLKPLQLFIFSREGEAKNQPRKTVYQRRRWMDHKNQMRDMCQRTSLAELGVFAVSCRILQFGWGKWFWAKQADVLKSGIFQGFVFAHLEAKHSWSWFVLR